MTRRFAALLGLSLLAACTLGARDARSHASGQTAKNGEHDIWISYYGQFRSGEFQAITREGLSCTGSFTVVPRQQVRLPISCNDGSAGWAEITADPETRNAEVRFAADNGFAAQASLTDYPYSFP